MLNVSQEKIDKEMYKLLKQLKQHQDAFSENMTNNFKVYRSLPDLLKQNVFLGSNSYGRNMIA